MWDILHGLWTSESVENFQYLDIIYSAYKKGSNIKEKVTNDTNFVRMTDTPQRHILERNLRDTKCRVLYSLTEEKTILRTGVRKNEVQFGSHVL